MYSLLMFCLCVSQVFCYYFNEKAVTTFSLGRNDTYFGYSVLLQRGNNSRVIVGAPKADQHGGGLYCCTLSSVCEKYPDIISNNEHTYTSNFLGSSLDGSDLAGEDIIVCSPQTVVDSRYQLGVCFHHSESVKTHILNPLKNRPYTHGNKYYDYGYAQAGFSLHYLKEQNTVVLGTPGVKDFSGIVIEQPLSHTQEYSELPWRDVLTRADRYGYLGYSVTAGNLLKNSRKPYQIVTGAPRAEQMMGKVIIYNNGQVAGNYIGDKIGAYFGAVVLTVDVDNDGTDELFVGAPFDAGNTYDEGCVKFYGTKFTNIYELRGSRKIGARFGSAIASLGDINLDSYNDVAISAPYEDDGVGAVYIFLGDKSGIQKSYRQRLSPMSFKKGLVNTKGFGLGLSRGNDIDGNGHNDLAVGAYRSGEVFLFKARSIIDYKLILKPNVTHVTNSETINVTYCIEYTKKIQTKVQDPVKFMLTLNLDYRTQGQKTFLVNCSVRLHQRICNHTVVKISEKLINLEPYTISLNAESLSDVIAEGKSDVKLIPYAHGCGSDNVCQTKIILKQSCNTYKLIQGRDKEVSLNITADNQGETGWECYLTIRHPEQIELSQNSLCKFENETNVCKFASKITSPKTNTYKFDVSRLSLNTTIVMLNFEMNCLVGNNSANRGTTAIFNVLMENSPFIQGVSASDRKYFLRSQPEDIKITQVFKVGNDGPSPVKLDVFFILPMLEYNKKSVFEFSKVTYNEYSQECLVTNKTSLGQNSFDSESIVKEPLNETVVYDSFKKGSRYIEIFCEGEYLPKTSQIARYEVTVTVKTQVISEMYENQFLKKNVIAYVVSAFLSNSTTRVEAHGVTLLQSSAQSTKYLWIYIAIGAGLGMILLALLTYGLYRCHFFDRSLRDKMNEVNNELCEAENDDTQDTEEILEVPIDEDEEIK